MDIDKLPDELAVTIRTGVWGGVFWDFPIRKRPMPLGMPLRTLLAHLSRCPGKWLFERTKQADAARIHSVRR
jgi:hypothetical protein